MNNEILHYQAMLNVCKEKMSKIKFFEISKETMDEVHKSLEEWFSRGKTLLQVHEAATTSYHYHHPNFHTSFRVKASLMLVLMILIFPQL